MAMKKYITSKDIRSNPRKYAGAFLVIEDITAGSIWSDWKEGLIGTVIEVIVTNTDGETYLQHIDKRTRSITKEFFVDATFSILYP